MGNQHDLGPIFELLCDSCAAMPIKSSAEDAADSQDIVQDLISTQPAAAKALCQYIHGKCSQKEGLGALAVPSSEADTLSCLLNALAFAASILVEQVTAGAMRQLQRQQLQPHGFSLDFKESTSAAAITYYPSNSSLAAPGTPGSPSNTASGPAAPPSWLHPLLHHLRPDQVVVLASQLLLYLAGLLEAK